MVVDGRGEEAAGVNLDAVDEVTVGPLVLVHHGVHPVPTRAFDCRHALILSWSLRPVDVQLDVGVVIGQATGDRPGDQHSSHVRIGCVGGCRSLGDPQASFDCGRSAHQTCVTDRCQARYRAVSPTGGGMKHPHRGMSDPDERDDRGVAAIHVPPAPGDSIVEVAAQVARVDIDYLLSPISIAKPYLEARTLVALGVSTAQRSPWLPDAPTVAEQGIDGFDFPIWYGAWVRVGTLRRHRPDPRGRPLRRDGILSAQRMVQPPWRRADAETTGGFARFVTDEARRAVAIIRKGPPG